MGLDQCVVVIELNGAFRETRGQGLANVSEGYGVEDAPDLDMTIAGDLDLRPGDGFKRLGR